MALRPLLLAGTATVLLSLASADSAAACTCVPPRAESAFRHSDAAIIARLTEVTPRGESEARFDYRVTRVFKGRQQLERGDEISIRSSLYDASCGLPSEEGKRYGLFLDRRHGRWSAGLCSVVTPREMRRMADRTGHARTACSA